MNNEEINITLTINKEKQPDLYEKVSKLENKEKYLDYLTKLDLTLNGSGHVWYCYNKYKDHKSEIAKCSEYRLLKRALEKIKNIKNYVSDVKNEIPDEYSEVYFGPEECLINIPDDDIIDNLLIDVKELETEIKSLYERYLPILTEIVLTAINTVDPEDIIANGGSEKEYKMEAVEIAKLILEFGTDDLKDRINNVFSIFMGMPLKDKEAKTIESLINLHLNDC